MTGLLICLRSAAKITHKAQAITSHAATWHVFATIESFDEGTEDPTSVTSAGAYPLSNSPVESDDEARDEDELDDTKLVPPSHVNTISFQKRQALGESTHVLSANLICLPRMHVNFLVFRTLV